MYNLYMNKCKVCRKDLRSNEQCCTLCPYCHDYHQISQLTQSICPKMKQFISLIRPVEQFSCSECEGDGKFTKITKISYYESTKKYHQRIAEWERQNKQNSPKPSRKLLRQDKQETLLLNCRKCDGTGAIKRIIPCKNQSCRRCLVSKVRSKLHINPHWASLHRSAVELQPSHLREICSYCRRNILNNKRVKLSCGHILHGHCYEELLQQGSCTVCQTVVSWRQVQQITKNITKLRKQQMKLEQYINDDSFCIRKAKNGKFQDQQIDIVAQQLNNLSFKMETSLFEQDRSELQISSVNSHTENMDYSDGEQYGYYVGFGNTS